MHFLNGVTDQFYFINPNEESLKLTNSEYATYLYYLLISHMSYNVKLYLQNFPYLNCLGNSLEQTFEIPYCLQKV